MHHASNLHRRAAGRQGGQASWQAGTRVAFAGTGQRPPPYTVHGITGGTEPPPIDRQT
jgi:hypothetical protein